ncbi:hypothetical protein LXA43DRAFT_1096518 [Ganoderma leucocontextum]|nr:hypothetical protein LXA43DRAFT_1096518 [Ganoderma leucocontextum]
MPFVTILSYDDVKFSTTDRLGSPDVTQTGSGDHWLSVKVSVQEIGLIDRWMMVEVNGGTPPNLPLIHRALCDSWVLSCDEVALTMVLCSQDAETLTTVTQKLRFNKSSDFWSFLFQLSLSRVREARS